MHMVQLHVSIDTFEGQPDIDIALIDPLDGVVGTSGYSRYIMRTPLDVLLHCWWRPAMPSEQWRAKSLPKVYAFAQDILVKSGFMTPLHWSQQVMPPEMAGATPWQIYDGQ